MLHEGLIGLVLTSLMILLFLGSMRATESCTALYSAFGARRICDFVHDGQHDQHDDSGRIGARILPRD